MLILHHLQLDHKEIHHLLGQFLQLVEDLEALLFPHQEQIPEGLEDLVAAERMLIQELLVMVVQQQTIQDQLNKVILVELVVQEFLLMVLAAAEVPVKLVKMLQVLQQEVEVEQD